MNKKTTGRKSGFRGLQAAHHNVDQHMPTIDHYDQLGSALVEETLDRARGRHRPYCAFDRPQDTYFVSSLASEELGDSGEFSESKPNHIGLKLRPKDDCRYLSLAVSFDIYLPSFPTWQEYQSLQPPTYTEATRQFRPETSFFRRQTVSITTELDTTPGDIHQEADRVTEQLQCAIETVVSEYHDEYLLRTTTGGANDRFDITNRDDFERLRQEIYRRDTAIPTWDVEFDIVQRSDELRLRLANRTEEDESGVTDRYLFNPKIAVDGEFKQYQLSLIPSDFRYEREIWGKGQNCSVDTSVDRNTGRGHVETSSVPEHQSYRFKQNDEYQAALRPECLSDPSEYLAALEAVEEGMSAYLSRWRGPLKRTKEEELNDEEMKQFLEAADSFEQEIDYFRAGMKILAEIEDAERAFTLMNRAFAQQDNGMDSWYPFQMVYIVSNIGAIVSREYPSVESEKDDLAEVLWFPTGGGKTEAYLGLVVFALLFDRIRGKEKGVTSWIRFPLRLLGKQQKDRFLSILHEANKVREASLDSCGEPFSIGYFVGSHDTPNSIQKDGRNNLWSTFQKNKDVLRDKCRVVTDCPECGGTVDVEFDPKINTVHHHCTADDCSVDQLPLYVTDHDIYRNIPSVLLGTLDKISITGANPRFTNLLGNFTDTCPVHGKGYAGKCSESSTLGCQRDLEPVEEELYDPIPTLHLVDEVHLLNEELGVFAGQYETLYQELCRQISEESTEPKIVTSTATIAEYETHMENLFLKEGNRFPEEGPTLHESFYGAVDFDDPERRYIGITPVNKTHIYAVLDLVKRYHKVIRDARDANPEEFGLDVDEEAFEEILDVYELSVVYFLRKTEKDRFLRSIENQIDREMRNEGYTETINTEQLTADIESTEILDEFEEATGSFEDRPDTVAATSFIGHGIDVDRFNMMFFFGFPSETFQYIQSSARVGRKYPGTVVDIFRPYDERDKHRYKYFEKTHEYLRRSVESVSIDRWSKFSLEKTFAGVYKALLIQYYRPIIHSEYDLNVQSSRELQDIIGAPEEYSEFSRERYGELLERSFGVHKRHEEYFEQRIEEKTEDYWDYWLKKLQHKPYTTIKGNAMRSLRDIGEQVEISPDNNEIGFYSSLTESK